MRTIIFSILFVSCFYARVGAEEIIQKELSYNIGLVNASYAEGQSALSGKNQTEAASGSVSSISGQITYKFAPGLERSYYFSGTFPLMPNPTGSYFGGHFGSEFYFGSSSGSKVSYINSGTSIKLKPKNLYFWGLEGGLGYLVYNTETAKKTDLLLDIGANLGMLYVLNDKWRLRGILGFTRGTGVTTTTMEMKAFFGVSYFND
ncbi:MAG: hypothetical protein H0V66_00045 [Bdellovibrionales bacterium]|nr:hypothetical protein [Bdellovibrionales bacterium]